jgi:hypothetical protein
MLEKTAKFSRFSSFSPRDLWAGQLMPWKYSAQLADGGGMGGRTTEEQEEGMGGAKESA